MKSPFRLEAIPFLLISTTIFSNSALRLLFLRHGLDFFPDLADICFFFLSFYVAHFLK